MSSTITAMTDQPVTQFLSQVEHPGRREDAFVLEKLFRDVTGFEPRMWGTSLVGYGQYHYRYDSGREGDFLATGFSPRKAHMSIYILPGYTNFDHILRKLGPHKTGMSCLYVGRLSGIDLDLLATLIRAGLDDLSARWPVTAT